MEKIVNRYQKFKRMEMLTQDDIYNLFNNFLVGKINDDRLIVDSSAILVSYGYTLRDFDLFKNSFRVKLKDKFNKLFSMQKKNNEIKEILNGYDIDSDVYSNQINNLKSSEEIVFDTMKELLVNCECVKKIDLLNQNNVDKLRNNIYFLLEFSNVDKEELCEYLNDNIMMVNSKIEDYKKEIILDIVLNSVSISKKNR